MFFGRAKSQIGINNTMPDSNAIVDISSSDKGFLVPRLTTAQREIMAASGFAQGMIVYDTDLDILFVGYGNGQNSNKWYALNPWESEYRTAGNSSQAHLTTMTSSGVNHGNVGIGISQPTKKLEANGTNSELNIEGDIIMNSVSDSSNVIHLRNEGKLNIGGNILRPTIFGALKMESDGKLVFNGSQPQTIPPGKLDNSGSDSLFYGIVSLENTSNSPFELTDDFLVKDSLILSFGNIKTSSSSLLIIEDGAFIKGGDSDSYVQGPMMKKGATIGEAFTFPIGDATNFAPMTITPLNSSSAAEYTAQYQHSDPPPFGVINLNHVNDSEYWDLSKSSGTPDAHVTLSWHDAANQGINNLTAINKLGAHPFILQCTLPKQNLLQ